MNKIHLKRKYSLSLIEMIAGIFLFSILITLVFQTFKVISINHHSLSQREAIILKERHFHFTLSQYLDKLAANNGETYTLQPANNSQSLSFRASGFIDRDPEFFGDRKISIQQIGDTLTLTEAGSSGKSVRITPLFSDCDSVEFAFLYYDEKSSPACFYETSTLTKTTPHALIIRIHVRGGNTRSYAFLTPADLLPLYTIKLDEATS